MRIAWITDPHLNHCSLSSWERLVVQLNSCQCDAIVITGDISEGDDVVFQLMRLVDAVTVPIHFVLGNHDFYQSSIQQTRADVGDAVEKQIRLHYLRNEQAIELSPTVGLVGEDGWGDATEGNYEQSTVLLNDFQLIEDFRLRHPSQWRRELESLGRDAAVRLQHKLEQACAEYSSVLVATHVPPFRESCWYEGRTTNDDWAPFFVCGQAGQVLRDVANRNPLTKIEVICGHTHHAGVAVLTPNLRVTTAGAVYGRPEITSIIVVADTIDMMRSS
jgi:Icc protein